MHVMVVSSPKTVSHLENLQPGTVYAVHGGELGSKAFRMVVTNHSGSRSILDFKTMKVDSIQVFPAPPIEIYDKPCLTVTVV